MSIGTQLREARREAGLSQLQAATEVGAEQSTIWRYEASRKIPPAKMLEQLAILYNKSPQWFSEEYEAPDQPEWDEKSGEDQPDGTASTRWTLKRTGLSVLLEIQCNPERRPDSTYYWNANLFVKEDGFINIGRTWLQSVDDTMPEEMHPRQQACLSNKPGPIRQIDPQDLEESCNRLAKKCYDLSQRAEIAPDLDHETETELTTENADSPPKTRKSQSLAMIDSLESKTKTLNQ